MACDDHRRRLDEAYGKLIGQIFQARAQGNEPMDVPSVREAKNEVDKALSEYSACQCVIFAREGFFG